MTKWMRVGEAVAVEEVDERLGMGTTYLTDRAYVQAVRPSGFVQGRAVYITFRKLQDQWYYAGHCYEGETSQALAEKG